MKVTLRSLLAKGVLSAWVFAFALLLSVPAARVASAAPLTQATDDCGPELASVFAPEFQVLAAVLGEQMGTPLACPTWGEGDNLFQETSTGQAIYLLAEGLPAFSAGTDVWVQTAEGVVYFSSPEDPGVLVSAAPAPVDAETGSVTSPEDQGAPIAAEPEPVTIAPDPLPVAPTASQPSQLVGTWQYTSAQYQDGARGLRTVGIGGDLRLSADSRFNMSINFGSAAGRRTGAGSYSVTGDRLTFTTDAGATETYVVVLGDRPGASGGIVDTMTMTPPGPDSYTYTLTKPR